MCRRKDFDICHQFIAQQATKGIEIELAASSKRSREVLVTDDLGALESSVAEEVIGMGMGIDDVPNWLCRHCADGCKQTAAFAHASAAINQSDSVVTDDKSHVGDC